MEKVLSIFILLGTLICQVHAQQRSSREQFGYFGISAGSSIPISDFSSKSSSNEQAGWADTGGFIDLSFGYQLGEEDFGVVALVRGQLNPLDMDAFANALSAEIPGTTWFPQKANWTFGSVMIGVYRGFQISKGTSLDAKCMVGLLNAVSPEIRLSGLAPPLSVDFIQSKASATTSAFLIGLGFRQEMNRSLSLIGQLDYLNANPSFENVELTTSDGTNLFNETASFEQRVRTINLSFGIARRF